MRTFLSVEVRESLAELVDREVTNPVHFRM